MSPPSGYFGEIQGEYFHTEQDSLRDQPRGNMKGLGVGGLQNNLVGKAETVPAEGACSTLGGGEETA